MIDRYLSFFKKSKIQTYIDKIINIEIDKSSQLGLSLKKKDIELEKKVIYNAFKDRSDSIKSADDYEYNNIRRQISSEIYGKLETQLKYYFDTTPIGEVRSKYNCHLDSIISILMINISNDKI